MSHHSHHAWEYTILSRNALASLNSLGAEGWQMITDTKDPDTDFILKRPKRTFQEQVTLDQRKRYFAEWGIDIDSVDRKSTA